jgi:hypothetical protein
MSGAEEGPVAPGKYTLLFNDVKDGLQKNIPNLNPALAESMAHTLIILVQRCEQKLDTSQHVHQDVDSKKIKQLDDHLKIFRVDGGHWAIECKTGSKTVYRQFNFPEEFDFDSFARHTINMTFNNGLFIEFENIKDGADGHSDMTGQPSLDNWRGDGNGADDDSMDTTMSMSDFTDRCVTKKP